MRHSDWRSAAFLNGKAAYCTLASGYTYREPALTCDSCSVVLTWVASFGIGKASSQALSSSAKLIKGIPVGPARPRETFAEFFARWRNREWGQAQPPS